LRLLLTFALVALAITISVFLGAGLLRVSLAAPARSTAPAAPPSAVGSGLGERSTSAGNTNADTVSGPNSVGVLLVNASHPLPQGYGPVETVKLEGIVPVLDDTVSTASELAEPLRRLFAAAGAAGHFDLYVTNGYRTYDEQRQLYDDAPDKSYVLPPGHSEHEAGLAVDIFVADVSEDMVATATSNEWLRANSWRYGFILRYPADKVRFTGIAYEPWHFRYVGEDIARVCYEQELCLEEYVEQYAA
jgi:D-alanyl-D-alanine carboxypeptidase